MKPDDAHNDAATDRDAAAGDILQRAAAASATALTEQDGKTILHHFGIRVPRNARVERSASVDDLEEATQSLAPPFVLKALSTGVLHKSESGAVQLGLNDATEVAAAIEAMQGRLDAHGISAVGFLIEETAPAGTELIIGGQVDARFGPILMVGLGGIFVEIFRDVAYRICPIDRRDAEEMLGSLQGAAVLGGVRGRSALDRRAVIDALLAVGGENGLFTRHSDRIAEFDINPLIVSERDAVAVDARVVLAPPDRQQAPLLVAPTDQQSFKALFEPRSIAVAGASATGTSPGNRYLRALKAYGFAGDIVPIHPTAETVEGLQAYPSLGAVERDIDFAHIAVAAPRVADVLAGANGNVRFAQIISSGFSEATGDDTLESDALRVAEAQGMRLLGPNCMGTHSPRGKATFMLGLSPDAGSVGIVSQSGGIGMDILTRGEALGLRFSGVVTNGNSIDVAPHELLAHFLDDAATKVIGFYLEDIKDGRAFLEALQRNNCTKPIVMMAGGLTTAGRQAAGSHTGALTSEEHIWQALARQTGTHLAYDHDAFLDALLVFQTLVPRPESTRSVVLFGNGGGTSVLGTDHIARAGFALSVVPDSVRGKLADIGVPDWVALANPIDVPAVQLKENDGGTAGAIVAAVLDDVRPDALIVHVNLAVILGYRDIPDLLSKLIASVMDACRKAQAETHLALVLRSDGSPACDEARRSIRAAVVADGIPVFDEVNRAAAALRVLANFEAARAARH
ncbi:MAG: acetate--CoA ligase family protein [Hyphomicrobiaceae bacterium]